MARSKTLKFRMAIAAAAITVAAMVLAAACGGDDDGGNETPSPSGSATPSQTLGPTPVPTAGPDATDMEKLSALYLAGLDGKTSYNLKIDKFGQQADGTLTVYRLGDNIREDWLSAPPGFQATEIYILAGDAAMVCTVIPSYTSCDSSPVADVKLLMSRFSVLQEIPAGVLEKIQDVTVTPLAAETIAGVAASCFDLEIAGRIGEGPAGTEQAEICFAEDGTLLRLNRTITFANGDPPAQLTVEALETGPASEADFEPVAPISGQ